MTIKITQNQNEEPFLERPRLRLVVLGFETRGVVFEETFVQPPPIFVE